MGTVISLLRSCIKSCPILGVWGSVSFMNHSASDKTKSYLSCDCLMLEFADVWDSGFQSLHSQSSQFEWSRESGECGVGIIACLFTFLHWLHCSEFPGRVHHLIVEPYEICALSRVTFFSFFVVVAETLQRERGQWGVFEKPPLFGSSLSLVVDFAFRPKTSSLIPILQPSNCNQQQQQGVKEKVNGMLPSEFKGGLPWRQVEGWGEQGGGGRWRRRRGGGGG